MAMGKKTPPQQGNQMDQKKYFMTIGNRNWVFSVKDKDDKVITLVKASDRAIVRHVKIKGDANPFDPQWDAYFEDRIGRQMTTNPAEKKKLARHWRERDGNCQNNNEAITSQTRWTLRYIVPRSLGGPDTFSNRVLVHQSCHGYINAKELVAI
ncbi:HNH endonuclease signature motif containing protein [Acidithrix ferrooxidans]|uniref:HNH domain-containing protein n=2 Tax=Acidithrix TaxID=1609233 RepID=A0A0D8HCR2_9ACTN|nr:HNH endonuclease signature motif containing protein [Acidithrix ferrooxidans]KJF15718.1 hypothetical protein AXFE_34480 [Acidithrix ferrooxidans]KJF17516.1 hypothetical protein AXFE_16370 [Acidithrix ferrooxidans]CAG4929310.1 unnamed protein product [Acidithrix sp. C25]